MADVGVIFETKWGNNYKCWRIARNPKVKKNNLCLVEDYHGMKPGEQLIESDIEHVVAASSTLQFLMTLAQAYTRY